MRLLCTLALAVSACCAADSDPALKNARIALRFTTEQVLIIGGESEGDNPPEPSAVEKFPVVPGFARWAPAERVLAAPPEFLAGLKTNPETRWRTGDRWVIYPGAGPPVTVTVEKEVFLEHGCIAGFVGATARFASTDVGNRIAGLRASEYLALPAPGLPGISQEPLMPLRPEEYGFGKVSEILTARARAIVKDENWFTKDVAKDLVETVRGLNRAFLAEERPPSDMSVLRWSPPGRKPLLLVKALWTDDKNTGLFAASAVFEEPGLRMLDFNSREAEFMRIAEFQNNTWKLEDLGAFLNAWKIGNRFYLLMVDVGYEGYSVNLEVLDPKEGLTPSGPSFGAGC